MTILVNDGTFTMQSTNIRNNNNNGSDSIASLVNITSVGSVTMSDVYMIDNQADVDIMDNINAISFTNNILIQANDFINANLSNNKFINNIESTVLFVSVLDGNVSLTNVEITNNTIDDMLMNVNGINDVTMNSEKIENNKALNGLHFIGTDNGTVERKFSIITYFE